MSRSAELAKETTSLVTKVFDIDCIEIAFIAGSVARSEETSTSDIDIVVGLTQNPTACQIEDFQAGYFELHGRFNLEPDNNYPGEVFGMQTLYQALVKTWEAVPEEQLTDIQIYDGIVWAGMLSARKTLLVPESNSLVSSVKFGRKVVDKYHAHLEHECSTNGDSVRFDLCLKEIIKYSTNENY